MNRPLLISAVFPFAVACGGGAAEPDTTSAPNDLHADAAPEQPSVAEQRIARADFVAMLSAAVCDGLASCCAAAGYASDPVQCRANLAHEYRGVYPEIETPDLRADYDPAAAAECIDALAHATRDCRRMSSRQAPSCNRLFRGQLAPGEPCAANAECSQPLGMAAYCPPVQYYSQRVCLAVPLGPQTQGDTCYGNDLGETAASSLGDVSLPCPARDNLRCDFDLGVCTPLPRLGERCVWHRPAVTVYDVCVSGAYCDPLSEVCIPQQTSGSCLVRGGDTPVITRACAPGTYCDTGADYQCHAELPDGANCQIDAACSAHFCNADRRCGIATAHACEGHLL